MLFICWKLTLKRDEEVMYVCSVTSFISVVLCSLFVYCTFRPLRMGRYLGWERARVDICRFEVRFCFCCDRILSLRKKVWKWIGIRCRRGYRRRHSYEASNLSEKLQSTSCWTCIDVLGMEQPYGDFHNFIFKDGFLNRCVLGYQCDVLNLKLEIVFSWSI